MQPVFFGESSKPLYGVVHPPLGQQYQNKAILICNPLGHEYIRCHRAIKQLATVLQQKGYFVMRFDYHGTGDSSGSFDEMSMESWTQDISDACEELKAVSGCEFISVIGIRFGASLAMASAQRCRFQQIVLWDPVVKGENYLNQLKHLRAELISSSYYYLMPRADSDLFPNEYLSYEYSEELLGDLRKFDLSNFLSERLSAYVVHTPNALDIEEFVEQKKLQSQNYLIDDMGDWGNLLLIESSMTPNFIIEKIVEIIG